MALQIGTLAASETAFLQFNDVSGNPIYDDGKPVGLLMYGPGSKAARTVQAQLMNELLQKQAAEGKKGAKPDDAATLQRKQIDLLTARTRSFVNFEYGGGDLGAAERIRAFYADPTLGHFHNQAAEFMDAWENFPPSSQTS